MDFTKIELLHDRVIIKPDEEKKQTVSGLYSTTETKKFPPEGEVVSIGNGKMTGEPDHAFTVKIGDRVKYERHSGVPYTDNYLLMRESNIISIIS